MNLCVYYLVVTRFWMYSGISGILVVCVRAMLYVATWLVSCVLRGHMRSWDAWSCVSRLRVARAWVCVVRVSTWWSCMWLLWWLGDCDSPVYVRLAFLRLNDSSRIKWEFSAYKLNGECGVVANDAVMIEFVLWRCLWVQWPNVNVLSCQY